MKLFQFSGDNITHVPEQINLEIDFQQDHEELMQYWKQTRLNFGIIGAQQVSKFTGIMHGMLIIILSTINFIYDTQEEVKQTQITDFVILCFMVILGITRYKYSPFTGVLNSVFWYIIWLFRGQVCVLTWGFWVATDLSLLYILVQVIFVMFILILGMYVSGHFLMLIGFILCVSITLATFGVSVVLIPVIMTAGHIMFCCCNYLYNRFVRAVNTVINFRVQVYWEFSRMIVQQILSRFRVGGNWKKEVQISLTKECTKINGIDVWGMPDCNLKNNTQYNYCMTNAFGYLLQVIPDDFDDKINQTNSTDEVIAQYITFGASIYNKFRDFPFIAGKVKNVSYSVKMIKDLGNFWERMEIKDKEYTRYVYRFDLRDSSLETDQLNSFVSQMGINIQYVKGSEAIKEDTHIIIKNCHAYIVPKNYYKYIGSDKEVKTPDQQKQKEKQKKTSNKPNTPHINGKNSQQNSSICSEIISGISSDTFEPEQKKEETWKEMVTRLSKDKRARFVFCNSKEYEQSAIIGQLGYVKKIEGNRAVLRQADFNVSLEVCNFPIDYDMSEYPFEEKKQICFNVWLVIPKGPVPTVPVYTHNLHIIEKDAVIELEMVERLKFLMTGLSLTADNFTVVKNRYLEYFNKHAVLDFKLQVCYDIYGELDERVNDALQYIFRSSSETLRVQHIELSQKKEWWKILMRNKNMEIFSRNAPKDGELLWEYIYRQLIPDNSIISKNMFVMIMSILSSNDETVAEAFLQCYLRFIDNSKNYVNDYVDSLINRFYEPKQVSRVITRIGGLRNEYYHKTCVKDYDIINTNPQVLQSMTFYHPITKEKLGLLDGEQVLELYTPFCTCAKNGSKRRVTEKIDNLPKSIAVASYAACPLNAICAIIQRQAASFLQPDPLCVQRFKRWYQKQNLEQEFIRAFESLDHTKYTFEKYIDHVNDSDKKKGLRYVMGRIKSLMTNSISLIMGCFPKTGEWFLKHIRQPITNMKNRSRNICNPSDELLGVCNHINYIGLACLKKVCPEYASYRNNEELQQLIYEAWQEISRYGQPYAISTDFSSHDANQHTCLLEIVDNSLWRKILPTIYRTTELPQRLYQQVLKALTNNITKLKYKFIYRKKMRTVFEAKIKGTVTSGHPTRTTFGNTLRVIQYYRFIFTELEIKHFKMFVGGDDFYCILTESDAKKLERHIFNYFSKTQEGMVGLGQCVKKVNMLGNKVDFLSKIGVIYPSKCFLFRQFPRIAYQQKFSSSSVKDYQTLLKAMCCSFFCSGYDFSYVKSICSQLGDLQEDMDLCKLLNQVSMYMNIPMSRLQHISLNLFSKPNSYKGADFDLLNITPQVGDYEHLDKYQIAGEIVDVINKKYDWLAKNLDQPGNVGGGYNIVTKEADMYYTNPGKRDFQGLISREIKNIGLIAKNEYQKQEQVISTAETNSGPHFKGTVQLDSKQINGEQLTSLKHGREERQIGAGKQNNTANKQQGQKLKVTNKNATIIGPKKKQRQGKTKSEALKTKFKENKYAMSLLNPFTTKAVRGPNDFCQPTSLYEYKFVIDLPGGLNNIQAIVYPHNLYDGGVHGYSHYFNAITTADGIRDQKVYYGSQGTDDPYFTQQVDHPMSKYLSDENDPNDNGRFVSYRVVRTGIKIMPVSNITVRQGVLTVGMVPGKTTGMLNNHVILPSSQRLRQYATSYEVALANLPVTGTDYIWVPLDPQDLVFMGSQRLLDGDALSYQNRNPIYMNFDGVASGDKYRIEIVSTIEYIASMNFVDWITPEVTTTTDHDFKQFNDIVKKQLPQAVSGTLGREITKLAGNIGQMITDRVANISMVDVLKTGMALF